MDKLLKKNNDEGEGDSPDGTQVDAALKQPISIKMLLRFTAPTVVSMIVMSIMGTVDGIFVARLIGPEAFAVINIVWPFLLIVMAASFMLGTGGNALVSKMLGEGRTQEARATFTLITVAAFFLSVVLSLVGFIFPEQLMTLLGASPELMADAHEYMFPLLWLLAPLVLGFNFQQFFVTEGKANYGMYAMIAGAIVNITLNWLLIGVFDMRFTGAALATGVNYLVPFTAGLIYFARNKKGMLYFTKFKLDFKALWKASTNGVPELVNMGAGAVTMTVVNNVVMNLEGPLGVTAFGVMWSTYALIVNIFMGYATGIIPLVSYNYGKNDHAKMKLLFKKSTQLISALAIFSILIGLFLIRPMLWIFDISYSSPVYEMARFGFRFFIVGSLFVGFNQFSSLFFTGLNNGLVAGIISICRTLVFMVASILMLSNLFGLTGVWLATPVAEFLALLLTTYLFIKMRKRYKYS